MRKTDTETKGKANKESGKAKPASENSPLTDHPLLLLEIGTEEIPARFLPEAMQKLKEGAEKLFSDYRLTAQSVKTYATPRRLSLVAEVDAMQKASEKEVWGPPVNVAFDQNGNPTKAAEAFAGTHGIKVGDLAKKEKGKGAYVVALIREGAQPTEELLPELLSSLIRSLNFPKSMRWGSGSFRFARPIHWILATYRNKRAVFELDGIKSNNITRGHRFLAPAPFEVKDSKAYVPLLRNNFVILDPEERKKAITDGARALASSAGSVLVEDEELLRHVSFLIEYPVPVLGSFSADYLSLPKELLITVMKSHQKYFAVEDKKGKLSNHFIVVSNTKQDNAGTVRKGAEKVLKARFEDARFYYEEDRKIPLKDRLEGLKKVIYHDRLGTIFDKCIRISSIAEFIASKCLPKKKGDVTTAALHAKADLISGVVREFPELQGIMGGYYALNDGYGEEIAKALSEQYLPGYSGDRLPETGIGTILSLSDKLDNIASFFMLGLTPTGAEDPFALRRQAIGIISMLFEKRWALPLAELFSRALQPFKLKKHEAVLNDILKFVEQRVEPLLLSAGYPLDAVSSVMPFVKDKPLYSVRDRIVAVQRAREDAAFAPFLLAIKRINNIAPKGATPPVDKKLFSEQEEKTLYEAIESVASTVNTLIGEDKYYDALKLLMSLTAQVNAFFDKVLVMDKDEKIKQNRLALIKSIQALAQQLAEFSKLG
ncbi:MAG TPA: glycine--tRNA ligase subunit beta [Dissulfurispiraceae bacterium]